MQKKSRRLRARRCSRANGPLRRGLTAPEVLVIIALLGLLILVLAVSLPRGREAARLAGCRQNLRRIGVGIALFDGRTGHLPEVPRLRPGDSARAPGPLRALLEELGQADLTGLDDPAHPPSRVAGLEVVERRLPGFTCPNDPDTRAGTLPAPVSYRACAGSLPDGRDGAFAPGRRSSLRDIEEADGLGFTAVFSERLVGNGRPVVSSANYADLPGPLVGNSCPDGSPADWRGDAGSSWFTSDWRSTLYNHAIPPDSPRSCIAGDRESALMGASSTHIAGVNVLIADGSVRTFTRRVDPRVWADLATTDNSRRPPSRPAPQPVGGDRP